MPGSIHRRIGRFVLIAFVLLIDLGQVVDSTHLVTAYSIVLTTLNLIAGASIAGMMTVLFTEQSPNALPHAVEKVLKILFFTSPLLYLLGVHMLVAFLDPDAVLSID